MSEKKNEKAEKTEKPADDECDADDLDHFAVAFCTTLPVMYAPTVAIITAL